MIGRHLDEIPVEGCEQVPVLRLVRGTRFAAARRALETCLELGGVEPIKKLDERRACRLRSCNLVSLALSERFAQPAHGIQPTSLVLRKQIDDEIFDRGARQRGTRI